MLGILWFLFIATSVSFSLVWLLDNEGMVVVNWLGYQAQMDILTAILLAVFFTILVFIFSYLLTRILAIKFPNFLKLFFKKNYVRQLEKAIHRHHQAFDLMANSLLALEAHDHKLAEDLQKKFSKLVKNPQINNFFLGKIFFEKADFSKSVEFFSKFGENRNSKILVLKSKFKLALQNQDDVGAMAYAKQILSVKYIDFEIVRTLFLLYKKNGLWQDAKDLIVKYGSENFRDELQKRDVAVINSALAFDFYRSRKFSEAIKHAKIALKAENNFLPALEIMLKCWIKRGFAFKANWMIKNLWKENPHLIFAEIFDLSNRKSSAKNRIKAMKKLVKTQDESYLGNLAIAMVAYKVGEFALAKEFLQKSLEKEKTSRAYRVLAFVEKALKNQAGFEKNITKAEAIKHNEHYTCNACDYSSAKWSAKCSNCDAYDSLEWAA